MEDNKPVNSTPASVPQVVAPTTPTTPPVSQTSIATPPQPPQPSVVKKSNKKMFIIAGIIVLLLVLVLGGALAFTQMQPSQLVVTPTPPPVAVTTQEPEVNNSMAGWKNYTNKEFGFKFNYPTELGVTENIENGSLFPKATDFWVSIPGSDQIYLFLSIFNSSLEPSEWWRQEGKALFENNAKETSKLIPNGGNINLTYSEVSPVKINDFSGVKVKVSSDYHTPTTPEENFITILKREGSNNILVATYYELGTIGEMSTLQSEQILSTLSTPE